MRALRGIAGVVALAVAAAAVLSCAAAPQPAPQQAPQPAAPAAKPAQPAKAREPVTIRIGSLPHVESFADALLLEKILPAAYPYIKVEVIGFTSGGPSVAALQSGQTDAAVIVGEQPAINGIANKAPYKIVASYGWGQRHHGLVVPANSPIKSVAELKGKTVALPLGTSLHEFTGTMLKEKAGLSVGDITVANMQSPEAAVALKAGKIDGAAMDSATMQKVLADGVGRVLQDGRGTNWANTFLVLLTDKFIAERSVEARRLVEAYRLEQEFQQENAVLVGELYSSHPKVKLDFDPALKAITSFPRYPAITDPATVGVIQRVADFLYDQKQLKERLDVAKSGYVRTELYEEAEKRLGKFPYERGREMKVDMSQRGKSIDEALKPFVERLVKADPD